MTSEEQALAIADEIGKIYKHIDEISIDASPELLKDELSYCNMQLSRSAQLKAEAERLLNIARGDYADKYTKRLAASGTKFNATLFRISLEEATKDNQKLFTLVERLNRTLVHRIDSLRSNLSYEKIIFGHSEYTRQSQPHRREQHAPN